MIIIAAGAVALALRPVGWTGPAIALLAGGAAWAASEPTRERMGRLLWLAVVAAGLAVFAFARSRMVAPPLHATTAALAASAAAAVAEELFFRRLLYGALERFGPAVAITASALLFALVHVPHYGLAALPVDLAAGFVFGWQRWASGSWTAPAATHVFANLVQAW